ncbi:MAG: M3 family metallopeptidase [Bacteroidales bacterium]|nr:M3 family metallopeptidase [Bacteroidales bacterium]
MKHQDNPLLQAWSTPYQTPPFDKIKIEHYLPAFKEAIKEARKEIEEIKSNPDEPTFENTIAALDRSGECLNRISNIFFNLLEADSTPEMQQIAQDVSPLLTEFSNDIKLDGLLFEKVYQVHEHAEGLTTEQQMLLDDTYRSFVNSGAALSQYDKAQYRKMSSRLSLLALTYGENVLNATNAFSKHVTDKALLAGIPESRLAVARAKAEAKGLEGWLFDLSQPSVTAVLSYADNRELRKEIFMAYNTKAYKDKFDNQEIVKETLSLRHKVAQLLGYANFAEYVLKERMAANVENVMRLENELLKYSMPVAQRELAQVTEYAHSLGFEGELCRWDFAYYSEKLKTHRFQFNDEMLKPYFKLEKVIEGVFGLATDLFGLSFQPTQQVPVYHPDVKVFEVYRSERLMALLYLDFHPRDSKRGGAWMTEFREQHVDADGRDVRPLVSLVMNFTPSTPGHPSLLTFGELTTFMHEFGHALHGMLSEVHYSSISGTSVPRDFVELPSQLLENWAVEKEFLSKFAYHYQTGELIPDELVQKMKAFRNFNAGYASCRQLSFGLLDMMWHTTDPSKIKDVQEMERSAMAPAELLPLVDGTCMSTAFTHIFAGGYAAGYYGYKWAEVLDADAFSLFKEKGVYNKEVADSYVENILSKGGSDKPMNLYVKFRGREPKVDALLEREGLK